MDENKFLITVSGPPAVGTSSLCKKLSDELDAEVVSGGDIFRRIASERNLEPYELSEAAETDDTVDRSIDERLKNIINSHISGKSEYSRLIVDSRLAGWHADGRADLAIWLQAPIEVRVNRIEDRLEGVDELRRRERSDSQRYKQYYGIDTSDMSVYDLVIDTHTFSEIETLSITQTALEGRRL